MKQLFIFLFFLCAATVSAQDVIVKKDGSTIICRVVELTSSEITYKKWSDLNGSNYVMNRADASAINYEDGKKVNLSEAMNLYTPGNQNDGVQQYNDRALLQMDQSLNRDTYFKKAKLYKYIGIIGGAALIATGVILIPTVAKDLSGKLDPSVTVPSYFLIGVGAAGGVACILVANRYRNLGNMIQSTSLMHHEMKFDNGSSLMAGIDVLKDNYTRQQTLGLGLRYNF